MQLKLMLIWIALVTLVLLPGLACSATWALAAQPGPSRSVALPLLPGRVLEIDIQSCTADMPGRLFVWFIDTTTGNRFIREHFRLLLHTVMAPSCP